jgi:hypothetical protein
MPVNVPGVNQVLQLTIVPDAGDGGMGRKVHMLRQVPSIAFRSVGIPPIRRVVGLSHNVS